MGANHQVLIESAGQAGNLPPDATLWSGYSVLKLRTYPYSMRVRRDSDNAEQDIGFVGTALDTTALLAFVGSGSGYVKTWYDQSGGGNHLNQTTTSLQPAIVVSGTYLGELRWDGVDDYMVTSNTTGTPTAFTVYFAGRNRQLSVNSGAGSGTAFYPTQQNNSLREGQAYDSGSLVANWMPSVVFTGGSGGRRYFANPWATDGTVYTAVHDLSQASVATQNALYVNGTSQSSAQDLGSAGSGSFSAAVWYVGSSSVPGNYTRIAVQSLLVYQSAHSGGTISTTQALITPTYSVGALDSFTSNLKGCYSLRKQVSSYAGSCLRVRRSSDNTEQDIGFTAGGLIDSASMLSFVGANNGFVVTWYDQSSTGNNLTQATQAAQPQIVSSGSYLGTVRFDGSNDILTQVSNTGTPLGMTVITQASSRSTTGVQIEFEHANTSTDNDATITFQNGSGGIVSACAGTAGVVGGVWWTNWAGQVLATVFDRTQATDATQVTTFAGGRQITRDAANTNTTVINTAFLAKKWNVGGRPGGANFSSVDVTQFVFYEAALTAAQLESISGLLG